MAFIEKNETGLVYMTSSLIPARHAFTTRYGGVSTGHLSSLNLISGHGDEPENIRENFRRVAALMGAGPDDCAVTKQVHGAVVRLVDERDRHVCLSTVPYEADGIATATRQLPLFCFTADCVPVLLYEKDGKAAAAVHCGWRSAVGDILGEALRQLKTLGAQAQDLCAAIGPAIGRCCFETDDDVPEAITAWLGGDTAELFVRRADGKTLVDLRAANARRLMQLGVPAERIDVSEECTFCSHEKYWSHRYTKGQRGGQCACIVL